MVRVFDGWYVEVAKIDPDSPFSDIGVFVGECCVPLGASAKGASLAGRVALRSRRAFMRMEGITATSQRTLSRQAAFIHKMNTPVYHSGFPKVPKNLSSGMVSKELQTVRSVKPLSQREIIKIEGRISSWLGEETRLIRNKAGDPIFISKDGTRRVRFDFNNPHGDKIHMHIELKEGHRWKDASSTHRIYPKD